MIGDVEDMARHVESETEPDPTWEEAAAEFEAGEPVELARSPRTLVIDYRYSDDRWRATTSALAGFVVSAASLPEAKALVAAELAEYLDPAVKLDERVAEPVITRAAAQTFEIHGADILETPRTHSRTRSYIASRSLRVSA
jgi:hypothetical protein